MTQTTHLALPFIEAAQAQKHVTHNEALALIDALTQLSVSARNVTSPPATPAEGDRVLIGAGATGDFAGKSDQIATFLAGGWTFLSPQAGWRAYVEAESLLLLYDGAGWIDCGLSLRQLQNLALLGIGATADGANPLLAKLNATLFTAKSVGEGGSGDLRFALNKESAANTVSQLYESNYSGARRNRADRRRQFPRQSLARRLDLEGSDRRRQTTGEVAFPSGGPTKFTSSRSSGSYTPTPGMRFRRRAALWRRRRRRRRARDRHQAPSRQAEAGAAAAALRADDLPPLRSALRSASRSARGGNGGAAQTVEFSTAGNNGAAGGNTTVRDAAHRLRRRRRRGGRSAAARRRRGRCSTVGARMALARPAARAIRAGNGGSLTAGAASFRALAPAAAASRNGATARLAA